MRITILPAITMIALSGWLHASTEDAHVMLTVSEPGPRGIMTPIEFSKQAKPGAGKALAIWIESASACRAVVAAFNHEGQLAFDGAPSDVPVKAHSNNQIPAKDGRKWIWDGHENLAEIDVILMSGDSAPRDLSQLLQAMRDPSVSAPVRRLQAADLRRWIDSQSHNASLASDYSIKPTPVAIGGMTRGDSCDWCKDAHQVSIPANGVAIVRIHID